MNRTRLTGLDAIARTCCALLIAGLLAYAVFTFPSPRDPSLEHKTFVAGIRG